MAILLVACGGGGGGGGGGGDGEAPRARAWQTAQTLDTRVSSVQHHATAIGANGVGYASWTQPVAGQLDVFFSRYAGGVWGPPQQLPNDDPVAIASQPQVAVHPDGEGTAVWVNDLLNGQNQIMAAHSVAGVWGTAFGIHTGTGVISDVGLVSDGKGRMVAVWTQGETAFASHGAQGELFGPRQQISVETAAQAKSLRVSMNAAGEALAVWVENHLNVPKIHYQAYVAGGWRGAQILNPDLAGDGNFPDVALGLNGQAVVAWEQDIGTESGVAVRVASNAFTGAWGAVETAAGVNAFRPSVAISRTRGSMVVWQQNEFNTQTSVFAALHDGLTLSPPAVIEFDDADHASRPRIASDGLGNVFAVWRRSAGASSHVESNRFDGTTGTWGRPERIETFSEGIGDYPLPAFNAQGEGVVVWLQSPSAGAADVVANVFR